MRQDFLFFCPHIVKRISAYFGNQKAKKHKEKFSKVMKYRKKQRAIELKQQKCL